MIDVLGYLFLLAILAVAIWIMVSVFRSGVKAKFFLSSGFLNPLCLITGIFLFGSLLDWFLEKEIDWGARIWSYAIICAVCAILYTFGFLTGLLKRSRNEGIIGLGDY